MTNPDAMTTKVFAQSLIRVSLMWPWTLRGSWEALTDPLGTVCLYRFCGEALDLALRSMSLRP